MKPMILAIDQGTTSTRAIVFGPDWRPAASSQIELVQHYPRPGWVEHDPEEIWRATVQVCREALDRAGGASAVTAIGLTNQRETTVLWDRRTGEVLHNAIVWQDRRTAGVCEALAAQGVADAVLQATGLVLDPYFSATKIAWLLDAVPGARERAARGELAAGTIDSFLIWRLTGGRVHAADVTNASRTSLLDLERKVWRDDLLELFRVPAEVLPQVRDCDAGFGETTPELFGRPIPITGVAGDQQAALVGHAALRAGEAKVTFGTGAFLVMNVGDRPRRSNRKLLGTVGFAAGGRTSWALEGSIFSAGSTVQWLRDGLGLVSASRETEVLAEGLADNGGVYLVPGFTGLGAPWWSAEARGTVVGLTRDSGRAHLVRAGLEAIAYQTVDLLEVLGPARAPRPESLRVDGGVTANGWAMQFLADVADAPVERPAFQETTALGAARLAALGAGLIDDLAVEDPDAPARWTPRMAASEREALLAGWRRAVRAALAAAEP